MEAALAEKFVEEITRYTDYNINIMNGQGVVIASKNPDRVGTFHDVAYQIVTGTEDLVVTSRQDDYPGVKPGINMVISVDGRREGVVGITGDPKEVRPIALMIKMTIETMLKYENQQQAIRLRQSQKEQFMMLLTKEEFAGTGTLHSLAKQLNYEEERIRIPILCKVGRIPPELLLERIKNQEGHGVQDMSFILDETHILVFKTVEVSEGALFTVYKSTLEEYLKPVLEWIGQKGAYCCFYIGSFQRSLSQYCHAYGHCKWMEETLEESLPVLFFYDYARLYMQAIAPVNELQRMFQVFEKELNTEFLYNYQETMEALMTCNYNLVSAARQLFVHKNTLQYRYNKIKEVLNVNPIASASDRYFLEAFYQYLKKH